MKIIHNYLYNVGYQILTLITPLITVPYISRVLGPTGVGINAYTGSYITYFLLIGTIGITTYGNREIAFVREDSYKRSKYFYEIELLQVIMIFFAYLLFLVFLQFTTRYGQYFFYQSFAIIAGAFDVSWFFMGLEDFKKTVIRNTIVKLASLGAIFILVKTPNDVGIYILIISLSSLIGNITLWPYLKAYLVKVKIADLRPFAHFKTSFSLFIPQISVQIYLAVNKTMLGSLDTVTAAGYFDYSDKLIKLVLAIVTATGTVMLPHMANMYAKKKYQEMRKTIYASFEFVTFLATPLMFGVIAIATALAPWYFGREFSSVGSLLQMESIVILLVGWSNVIGTQYLVPTEKVHTYTKSVTLGALVNIVLNFAFIIWFGVFGAMIATVISELVVTVYQLIAVRKQLNLRVMASEIWKYMISGLIMFLVVYMLNINMKISAISLALQIIEGVLVYLGCLMILQPKLIWYSKQLKQLFTGA